MKKLNSVVLKFMQFFAQNKAPLCCLELLFEIETTVSTLVLFWVVLFLRSCLGFFSLNGNNDLFLLLKEMMVLEQTAPVFKFVFFSLSLSLYLSLTVQKAFINNYTAFFCLF